MADTAANAARATGFLDTAELISDLQASAALAHAKTRMTMQFCAQATLAFLRHSKDKEDSQHLNAQPARCRLGMRITSTQAQALLWFCDPAYRKLDMPLISKTVNRSLLFGDFPISLCSEIGLLRFNGLVNHKVMDHLILLGLSCTLISASQLSAM